MNSRVVAHLGRSIPKTTLRRSGASAAASSTRQLLFNNGARTSSAAIQQLTVLGGHSNNFSAVRAFSDNSKGEEAKKATEEEKPAAEESAESEGEAEAAKQEGKTEADVEVPREEQLEAELKQVKDQLLRSLAEQENTRRIAQRDVQDARNFAVKSFAKSLLETSDNLSRAMEVVPEDMRHDKEKNSILVNLYEGIEMTEKELMKAFASNGLKKYGQVGDKFDPNQHEALYEYPDAEKEAGTVGQVIKVGYTLNDRVLRPAEVGVVKKE